MKIIVVAGASGGHIFPALSFLDALKEKNKSIGTLLVLPKKIYLTRTILDGYNVRHISISNIKLSLDFNNLIAILMFFKSFFESIFILLEFRPDAAVGFGSLISVPVMLSAWFFRIKTLIHEQNVIPGKANSFLARFVDKVAISFTETKGRFKGRMGEIVLTGNPMRKELNRIDKRRSRDFLGLDSDKFTMLVMGGSSGSSRINHEFLKAAMLVQEKTKFQIIHLAGQRDYDSLGASYRDLGINVKLFSFFSEMQYAYSASDLIICRAGATTIAEVIFFGLPAVIIPYPFAYEHQMSNAEFLKKNGCAIIIKDNDLGAHLLKDVIEGFIDNPERIKKMQSQYFNIARLNAADLLTDEMLK